MKQSNIDRLRVSTYAIVVPLYDYASLGKDFLYSPCEDEWCEGVWLVMKWDAISATFRPHNYYDDEHKAFNAAMDIHNLTLKKTEGELAKGGIDDEPMPSPPLDIDEYIEEQSA